MSAPTECPKCGSADPAILRWDGEDGCTAGMQDPWHRRDRSDVAGGDTLSAERFAYLVGESMWVDDLVAHDEALRSRLTEAEELLRGMHKQAVRFLTEFTPFITAFEANDPWSSDGEELAAEMKAASTAARAFLGETP